MFFFGQRYECEPGFGEAICQKCNHTVFKKDVTSQEKLQSTKKGCISVLLLALYIVLLEMLGGIDFIDDTQRKGSNIPLLPLIFLPVLTAGGIATYFFMLPERINKK